MNVSRPSPDGLMVRLLPGEEIIESLKDLARGEDLPAAAFTGLGAVDDITLAAFLRESSSYRETRLTGELELASMTGNVAWLGEEPIIHAHGVVSRPDCTTAAGHIMRATVSITVEVMVQVYREKVLRRRDPGCGLNLLDLG